MAGKVEEISTVGATAASESASTGDEGFFPESFTGTLLWSATVFVAIGAVLRVSAKVLIPMAS